MDLTILGRPFTSRFSAQVDWLRNCQLSGTLFYHKSIFWRTWSSSLCPLIISLNPLILSAFTTTKICNIFRSRRSWRSRGRSVSSKFGNSLDISLSERSSHRFPLTCLWHGLIHCSLNHGQAFGLGWRFWSQGLIGVRSWIIFVVAFPRKRFLVKL